MGRAFLNHIISTQHLEKECVNKLLNNVNSTAELILEIKIAAVSFQNLLKTTLPMVIITARLQGNNETSFFAKDVCVAARLVEDDLNQVRFTNFTTDGVSVEICDIMLATCKCLDGRKNYYAAADNKHNIKNNRH